MSDFETVAEALFTQLTGGGDFVTTGRRVRHWTQEQQMPAFYLRRTGVIYTSDGLMTIRTMMFEAWIYCDAGKDPDAAADATLTDLEAALLARLAPDCHDDDEARFTLGGLVYWCRPEGRSDIAPGDQGNVSIIRLPILVTLP